MFLLLHRGVMCTKNIAKMASCAVHTPTKDHLLSCLLSFIAKQSRRFASNMIHIYRNTSCVVASMVYQTVRYQTVLYHSVEKYLYRPNSTWQHRQQLFGPCSRAVGSPVVCHCVQWPLRLVLVSLQKDQRDMSFIAAGALFSPPRSNSSSNLKGHI